MYTNVIAVSTLFRIRHFPFTKTIEKQTISCGFVSVSSENVALTFHFIRNVLRSQKLKSIFSHFVTEKAHIFIVSKQAISNVWLQFRHFIPSERWIFATTGFTLPVNIIIDWTSVAFWNKMAERSALWLDTMSWAVTFHTYRIYFYIHTRHMWCARRASLQQSCLRRRSHFHTFFHLFSGFAAWISEAKRSDAYNVWVYDRVMIL